MENLPANASLDLSPLQIQVLQLLAEGYTERTISSTLRKSEEAVHQAARRARERLGVYTSAQAVAVGIRRGLIT